jgi:hypothetical protein
MSALEAEKARKRPQTKSMTSVLNVLIELCTIAGSTVRSSSKPSMAAVGREMRGREGGRNNGEGNGEPLSITKTKLFKPFAIATGKHILQHREPIGKKGNDIYKLEIKINCYNKKGKCYVHYYAHPYLHMHTHTQKETHRHKNILFSEPVMTEGSCRISAISIASKGIRCTQRHACRTRSLGSSCRNTAFSNFFYVREKMRRKD